MNTEIQEQGVVDAMKSKPLTTEFENAVAESQKDMKSLLTALKGLPNLKEIQRLLGMNVPVENMAGTSNFPKK